MGGLARRRGDGVIPRASFLNFLPFGTYSLLR